LLVSPYYPPQASIAATRVHSHAITWARAGADVTVLTTSKQPDQRGAEVDSPGVRVEEIPFHIPAVLQTMRRVRQAPQPASDGVSLRAGVRSPLALLRSARQRTGVFASVRMPDLTDFWVRPAVQRALEMARERGPWDVVVASSGPYTALLAARRIVRAGAANHFVAEFRDLWTGNHIFRGCFPFTIVEAAAERGVLRDADLCVTVSEPLAQWLRARTAAPVEVVYNGHDGRRPLPAGSRTRDLVYTGSLYAKGQDPGPLFAGLALLVKERPEAAEGVRIVVAGPSSREEASAWLKAADTHGLTDRLSLPGRLSHEQAKDLQDRALALVSIEWRGCAGVLTGKIFEYLAARPPILVIGPEGTIAALVRQCGRGVATGDDPAEIARVIASAADGSLEQSLTPDEAAIASLTRENQSAHMLELIRNRIAERERQLDAVS